MNLWPDQPPGEATLRDGEQPPVERRTDERHLQHVTGPTLTIHRPADDKNSGVAIVVCPGGGYGILADGHEGRDVGQWLAERGITGVVLRYRHEPFRHPIPLSDARRAMQTVRASAKDWNIDPDRIGIMGFSAGGHLAASATVRPVDGDPGAGDAAEQVSSKPDFAVLVYPVIHMDNSAKTHQGSRDNLLGPGASERSAGEVQVLNYVDEQTPPTFLVHSRDDDIVPLANAIDFAAALEAHGVPHDSFIADTGGHGYGLGLGNPDTAGWADAMLAFLRKVDVLKEEK